MTRRDRSMQWWETAVFPLCSVHFQGVHVTFSMEDENKVSVLPVDESCVEKSTKYIIGEAKLQN